jgi:simple sugar transport system substrate-binding protein
MLTCKGVYREGVDRRARTAGNHTTRAWFLMIFLTLLLLSCASSPQESKTEKWVVGFSQFGHASEWRVAQTISIQDAFNNDSSFTLLFSDAQQSQENQLNALRSFIDRKVDVILFTPMVERGYGSILRKAAQAGIPVIAIDRDVAPEDRSLRLTRIVSDFTKEGEKAAVWLADYLKSQDIDDGLKPINIVELQGTVGADAAIDRGAGFRNILKKHSNWRITQSQSGNFESASGQSTMEAFLKADKNIQVVFTQNDQMALGAIKAIKEAGLSPGKDIIVVSEDAVKGAFEAIVAGSLNVSVECSPMVGPQALQAVMDLKDGKKVPNTIWTIEGVFDNKNAAEALESRKY